MSPNLVLRILIFFLTRLVMRHYGIDSNATKLLASLLSSHLYFIILPIILLCNHIFIKNIIILLSLLCIIIISLQFFTIKICSQQSINKIIDKKNQ